MSEPEREKANLWPKRARVVHSYLVLYLALLKMKKSLLYNAIKATL